MFPITSIGYMGNNIYPARAGEVLRAVVLKRREGVPISASLATIIVERIFDGVVMLGFVFVNLPELAKLTRQFGIRRQHPAAWHCGVAGVSSGRWRSSCWRPCSPRGHPPSGSGSSTGCCPSRFREQTSGIMHKFLDGLAVAALARRAS